MKKWIAVLVALMIALPLIASAHSGRTDSQGGHRDNQNKSGLGSYHFHHGMGPHLHPNGVCPYSAVPQATAKASSGGSSYGGGKSWYNTTAAPPRYNTKAPTPKPTVKPTPTPTPEPSKHLIEAPKPEATQVPWYKNVFKIAGVIVFGAPIAYFALLMVYGILISAWWRMVEFVERCKRR